MEAGGLTPAPDWQAVWLAPLARHGQAVSLGLSDGQTLPQALNAQPGCPVRFVPQASLPSGVAYEQFIFDTVQVPTRENLHDFFNGLCWLCFPLAKQRLNHLQASEIAHAGVGATRGPVRDTLTLFDENAALLQAPDVLWNALLARDWHGLFATHRARWAEARLVLFGHALLEKLEAPYKSITAHVWREPVPPTLGEDLAAWDAWLAGRLNAPLLATKPFTPLPVLGVPGWWPPNEAPDFYDDPAVFRAPRA